MMTSTCLNDRRRDAAAVRCKLRQIMIGPSGVTWEKTPKFLEFAGKAKASEFGTIRYAG
jgi:hypothetical protein